MTAITRRPPDAAALLPDAHFGAPRFQPRLVQLPAPAADQYEPTSEADEPFPDALAAHLARDLNHATAEVNSLVLADALPVSRDVDRAADILIEERRRRTEQATAELDAALAESRREHDLLCEKGAALTAWYQDECAKLTEQLKAQARRDAALRQGYQRTLARMRPKRRSKRSAG